MKKAEKGTLLGVAKAALENAEEDAMELNAIKQDLEKGNDEKALEEMREYFGVKKPPVREERLDENENQPAARA
jgi:excinuclease UvrABC nuclease subunit